MYGGSPGVCCGALPSEAAPAPSVSGSVLMLTSVAIFDAFFSSKILMSLLFTRTFVAALAAAAALLVPVGGLDNGLALTPPMGWSTFNAFRGDWNETIFKANVQAIVDSGLFKAGYSYANFDGTRVS